MPSQSQITSFINHRPINKSETRTISSKNETLSCKTGEIKNYNIALFTLISLLKENTDLNSKLSLIEKNALELINLIAKSKEKKEGNECENIGNKEENDGNKDKSNFKEVEDINDTESVPQKFEIKNKVNVKEVKVEKRAGKKNKIKKVDFDFDFDSFNDVNFSDFNKKENEEGETAPKKGKKKQAESDDEDDDDKEKKENERENRGGNGTKLSKEEISKKFAGKKAVSSEDYAALNDNGSQDKAINDRIKSFGKVTSISSSDVYGTEDDVYEGETFGSKMKDFAINLTLSAAEKAKEWKNKTNEIINSIQSKFTGY